MGGGSFTQAKENYILKIETQQSVVQGSCWHQKDAAKITVTSLQRGRPWHWEQAIFGELGLLLVLGRAANR